MTRSPRERVARPGDLLTARLHLSRFGPGDAALLADLDADPAVVKYVHLGPFAPPPRDRYAAEVLPKFLAFADRPAFGFWKVRPLLDNRPGPFAGWVFLRPVGAAGWYSHARDELDLDPRTPELGYRFARRFWGRGFATEAARRVLDRAAAFGEPDVCAIRQVDNAGSGGVMRKLGLADARTFQLPGVPRETVLAMNAAQYSS